MMTAATAAAATAVVTRRLTSAPISVAAARSA